MKSFSTAEIAFLSVPGLWPAKLLPLIASSKPQTCICMYVHSCDIIMCALVVARVYVCAGKRGHESPHGYIMKRGSSSSVSQTHDFYRLFTHADGSNVSNPFSTRRIYEGKAFSEIEMGSNDWYWSHHQGSFGDKLFRGSETFWDFHERLVCVPKATERSVWS